MKYYYKSSEKLKNHFSKTDVCPVMHIIIIKTINN
jgi:hypothetical protein